MFEMNKDSVSRRRMRQEGDFMALQDGSISVLNTGE
jgi:hypothetical protein